MAEPFKNIYNRKFFERFTEAVLVVEPNFDKNSFLAGIYDTEWEDKELKQRMRHISIVLKNHLSEDFEENTQTILRIIPELLKNGFKADNLEFIFFPDFIEIYGLENYQTSIMAFEQITQFVSCEFAVRPFIIKYEKKMINQMLVWGNHKHAMVRRLSTEGCRPRLPWAMAIKSLKENPTPIIPILEKLKNDASESVRRSIANNLNDISKDHPDTVIKIAKKWQNETKETDRLIKHGCRTLLKQGNTEALELFGFQDTKEIEINNFQIINPCVKIGGTLAFTFQLVNKSKSASLIRLEYGLYYQKANGSLAKKVFKISEKVYPENSTTTINRNQSFRLITTRKFHVGTHQLSLISNGKEGEKLDFELIN